jgi:hypothetical protein
MENLQHYYEIIENCIRSLSVDPAQCRGEKPGQWDLKKGSASVWIDIWRPEGTSEGYFQAMAPVVKLPADQPRTSSAKSSKSATSSTAWP